MCVVIDFTLYIEMYISSIRIIIFVAAFALDIIGRELLLRCLQSFTVSIYNFLNSDTVIFITSFLFFISFSFFLHLFAFCFI